MKRLILILTLLVLFLSLTGCPKKPPVPEEVVEDTVVYEDTIPEEPVDWGLFDTIEDPTFTEAELEKMFQEKVLKNLQVLYFDYNSYELSSEALEKLNIAANFLTAEPTLRILVTGHCDERGTTDYNMALGERRGHIVKDYLQKYGIDSRRIEVTSMGKERLVEIGCADEECHNGNRRAVYKVIKR